MNFLLNFRRFFISINQLKMRFMQQSLTAANFQKIKSFTSNITLFTNKYLEGWDQENVAKDEDKSWGQNQPDSSKADEWSTSWNTGTNRDNHDQDTNSKQEDTSNNASGDNWAGSWGGNSG